jgi:hypothetical protein
MARPELGVIIKPAPQSAFGLLLGGSYSFATNGNDNYGFNTLQSFNIQIGVVFMK